MTITVVFDPPLPSDSPSTFNTKAFTLLGDLNTWSTQANALPASVASSVSATISSTLASPPAIGGTAPNEGYFTKFVAYGVTNPADTNTAIGGNVLPVLTSGYANNVAIGSSSMTLMQAGSENVAIGKNSLSTSIAGLNNTVVGVNAASLNSYGSQNTYIGGFNGNQGGLDFRTLSNKVVLSDGLGNVVMHAQGTTKEVAFPGAIAVNGASSTIGYGSGSGGAVTQLTSKSTDVTLNKASGQITMHNASLAAGASVGFALVNSTIAATDNIIVSFSGASGFGINYNVWADVGSGSALIYLKNISAAPFSHAVFINFAVIKGATS